MNSQAKTTNPESETTTYRKVKEEGHQQTRYIIFKTKNEILKVKPEQIAYFEADRNYSNLFLTSRQKFIFCLNLSMIEKLLQSQLDYYHRFFIRVGKSHIINKSCLLQINIPRQKMKLLTDYNILFTIEASKESLRNLKDQVERDW